MDVETGRNFNFKDGKIIDPDARGTCIRIEISQVTVNVKQTSKLFLKVYQANKIFSKHYLSVFVLLQFLFMFTFLHFMNFSIVTTMEMLTL